MADDAPLDNVASLADPVRRAIYRVVVAGGGGGIDRNQVAEALDLSRSLAAYHLDRLVDDGLLVTRFEHRGTRRGPGSGRPSKIYDRAPAEYEVSLPPREYRLAAQVMADALESVDDGGSALTRAARRRGRRLRVDRPAKAAATDHVDGLDAATAELERCGYEPYRADDGLRLRNCPFHAVASEHRDLVCAMNLALLEGVFGTGPDATVRLRLEPAEGECCVAIRPRR